MKTINSKDLKILSELVHNSKATLTNLGDKLGLHPNVVAYRINKLENLGIIRDYTVNLDLEKLGLFEQVYLGASFPANSKRDTVIRQISDLPQTITMNGKEILWRRIHQDLYGVSKYPLVSRQRSTAAWHFHMAFTMMAKCLLFPKVGGAGSSESP